MDRQRWKEWAGRESSSDEPLRAALVHDGSSAAVRAFIVALEHGKAV